MSERARDAISGHPPHRKTYVDTAWKKTANIPLTWPADHTPRGSSGSAQVPHSGVDRGSACRASPKPRQPSWQHPRTSSPSSSPSLTARCLGPSQRMPLQMAPSMMKRRAQQLPSLTLLAPGCLLRPQPGRPPVRDNVPHRTSSCLRHPRLVSRGCLTPHQTRVVPKQRSDPGSWERMRGEVQQEVVGHQLAPRHGFSVGPCLHSRQPWPSFSVKAGEVKKAWRACRLRAGYFHAHAPWARSRPRPVRDRACAK